jgi:hypothetical protein
MIAAISIASAACAYRLPPAVPPSQYRIKLVANAPDRYNLRLRVHEPRDYAVPADGRVTLAVPAYRAGCSVYLFDKLRVRSGLNPFTKKTVDVLMGGKMVRQLSLKEIAALPTDADRNHVLGISAK